MPRKRGRPSKDNDTLALTVLQAGLLVEAGKEGIPTPVDAAQRLAHRIGQLTGAKDLATLSDSPAALEALAMLLETNPDAFLRHYATFLEFSRPKLARIEHQHEGDPRIGIFIATESREAGPPAHVKVVSEQ